MKYTKNETSHLEEVQNRLDNLLQMRSQLSDKKNGFYFGGNDEEIKILRYYLNFLRGENIES